MKRFTDTSIWKKSWFHKLPAELKLAWKFICDDCNHAGIYEANIVILNAYIGGTLTEEEILSAFKGRIRKLSDNKWFIERFIEFQYGPELNERSRVHKSVIKILDSQKIPHAYPINRLSDSLKDMDKDKDKDKQGNKSSGRRIPAKSEWLEYAKEARPDWPKADAESAWDYYDSINWMRGRNPIQKWKQCISTCYKNWKTNGRKIISRDTGTLNDGAFAGQEDEIDNLFK